MVASVQERLTSQDYRSLPETGQQFQLIEGDLYMAPAPNRLHQDISRNLALRISNHLEQQPVGKLYLAPFDVYLDERNVFQPDLVFIARENYSVLTDAGVEGAPDLIVEILSARTAKLDRTAKKRVYAEAGVKELWLVDPETRSVAIYDLRGDPETPLAVHGPSDRFGSPFFPGLLLVVAELFRQ